MNVSKFDEWFEANKNELGQTHRSDEKQAEIEQKIIEAKKERKYETNA